MLVGCGGCDLLSPKIPRASLTGDRQWVVSTIYSFRREVHNCFKCHGYDLLGCSKYFTQLDSSTKLALSPVSPLVHTVSAK